MATLESIETQLEELRVAIETVRDEQRLLSAKLRDILPQRSPVSAFPRTSDEPNVPEYFRRSGDVGVIFEVGKDVPVSEPQMIAKEELRDLAKDFKLTMQRDPKLKDRINAINAAVVRILSAETLGPTRIMFKYSPRHLVAGDDAPDE